MKSASLNDPFVLPCGAQIKNRLVKAAMTERIADANLEPTDEHVRLYERWASSGAGILITGNVIVDKVHLESSGNVVFSSEALLPKLEKWAAAGSMNNTHIWVQISHAGRQTNRFNTSEPKAPSAVKLDKLSSFGKPIPMTTEDIEEVVKGFVRTARLAKMAGFTGIQLHSAHGYLLSQFLSPVTNKREDEYGGSLKNRSRLLLRIIDEVRDEVGPQYPISVKLNSSDFQKGGFTEDDSLQVIEWLEAAGIDLLEISGGTYENVAFFSLNDEENLRESTKKREAYFMDFAKKVRAHSKLPLMITGGFRSYNFCSEVLASGELDFIGMARPFLTNLSQIPGFLEGAVEKLDDKVIRTGLRSFDDAAIGGYYARLIIKLAKGLRKPKRMNALWSSVFLIWYEMRKGFKRER